MCENNESEKRNCNCIGDILCKIIHLQRNSFTTCAPEGCDKPILGPENTSCYNTRPIELYNCTTGSLWCFPYTKDNKVKYSNVFRVESLDECCCTCRILYWDCDNETYMATNDFFTINLDCVCALQCLNDTFVDLC